MAQQQQPRLLDVSVDLNNGLKIPKYSFGTWKLDAKLATDTVVNAIESGFRHIDCARVYQNEKEVGDAFEKVISSGKVSRGDLFITSKLWNSDHQPSEVEAACRRTLADLRCGYLDLYLIHWPVAFKHVDDTLQGLFPIDKEGGGAITEDIPLEDTWKEMEKLVEKGLVKSIGVSNFSTEQVKNILKIAKVKPVVNQVELHCALPQTELRKDMAELGIAVEIYSPLGYGLSTDKSLMDDETIQKLAAKMNMKPAQFLLSWAGSLKNCCVLTKSQTLSRIQENAALTLVQFPEEILKELEEYGIKNKKRTVNPDIFQAKKGELFFKE